MDSTQKMIELFNEVADATMEQIKREKETTLSTGTCRMISLTQEIYNSINCYSTHEQVGINPLNLD